jgi:hypothetical protein
MYPLSPNLCNSNYRKFNINNFTKASCIRKKPISRKVSLKENKVFSDNEKDAKKLSSTILNKLAEKYKCI